MVITKLVACQSAGFNLETGRNILVNIYDEPLEVGKTYPLTIVVFAEVAAMEKNSEVVILMKTPSGTRLCGPLTIAQNCDTAKVMPCSSWFAVPEGVQSNASADYELTAFVQRGSVEAPPLVLRFR